MLLDSNPARPDWRLERRGEGAALRLTGDWTVREADPRAAASLDLLVAGGHGAGHLEVEASGLGRWDSALILFLLALRRTCGAKGVVLDESGLPSPVRRLLVMAGEMEPRAAARAAVPARPLLESVGQRTLSVAASLAAVNRLIGETTLRGAAALGARVRMRAVDVLELMREAGPGALLIVTIVNGLVGAILAFVGAVQLRRFGAEIFVADLVGIALVREMAAVMTAIVMAGRTGGAYAAQLATMQGGEEIDALGVFGIPVFDYLILPRFIALVVMMPLLYLYACAVGLLGGLVTSISVLDLNAVSYLAETREAIAGRHFVIGLTKSVAFGALVALAGCHIGLRAGRSASDVGRAATGAVVAGIIGVIVLDAVFALCTNALGV